VYGGNAGLRVAGYSTPYNAHDIYIDGFDVSYCKGKSGEEWAAALNVAGEPGGSTYVAQNVHLKNFHFSNCDRGIEFEDNALHCSASNGHIENITNDEPGTNYPDALDVHNHGGIPACYDINFDNIFLNDCGSILLSGYKCTAKNIDFRSPNTTDAAVAGGCLIVAGVQCSIMNSYADVGTDEVGNIAKINPWSYYGRIDGLRIADSIGSSNTGINLTTSSYYGIVKNCQVGKMNASFWSDANYGTYEDCVVETTGGTYEFRVTSYSLGTTLKGCTGALSLDSDYNFLAYHRGVVTIAGGERIINM
jgi:hypothetical protein